MDKKSPLKAKPLRQAGQSVDEAIQRVLNDDVSLILMYPAFLLLIAGLEWLRWWQDYPPQPIGFTVIFLLALLWAGRRLWTVKKRIRQLRLGRDGERAVGEFLERLRAQGAVIYHDVLGDGFNLDHVVICPQGIYVIETKTYSKPAKGEAKIRFDGSSLTLNHQSIGDAILIQARAEAYWLQQLLVEAVGKKLPVRAVVLFPGWYIEHTGAARQSDVWVLNPKALPTYIQNTPHSLTLEQLKTLNFNLSRHVRSS